MRTAALIVAVSLLLGGCSAAQNLLDDGLDGELDSAVVEVRNRADGLIARGQELGQTFDWCAGAADLSTAVFAGDAEGARTAVDKLLTTAPEDLTADLRVVAEAAARAQIGDPRVFLEDEVRDATRDVYAYAAELCGLRGGDG